MTKDDELDAIIAQREADMAELDDYDEDFRRKVRKEELKSEAEVFGDDPLDVADRILSTPVVAADATGLAGKAALREEKWANQQDRAPWVRINPVSALHGNLGGQQLVTTGENPVEVANWGGEDSEVLPVTITLAPQQQFSTTFNVSSIDPSPPGMAAARPYGIVQFGSRGALVKAEIDIALGTQFTVNASTVIVQVGMDSDSGTAISMKLSGMLGFYPIMRTAPLTRTRYIEGVATNAVEYVTVPPFSKTVTFMWSPASPAPTVGVLFYDSNFNALTVTGAATLTASQNGTATFVLPNDVVFVGMSATTNPIVQARAIFGLTL